jgi:hypothetical protein
MTEERRRELEDFAARIANLEASLERQIEQAAQVSGEHGRLIRLLAEWSVHITGLKETYALLVKAADED